MYCQCVQEDATGNGVLTVDALLPRLHTDADKALNEVPQREEDRKLDFHCPEVVKFVTSRSEENRALTST